MTFMSVRSGASSSHGHARATGPDGRHRRLNRKAKAKTAVKAVNALEAGATAPETYGERDTVNDRLSKGLNGRSERARDPVLRDTIFGDRPTG
ncbi:hypothetical protein ABZ815_01400 [Nonomuraea sp. NPDC047529]|uniref:hypothetical protein n=1 Tax=Nonomuraea sp. NPDC047529 TaxID=3155623 RepID=UPI0034003DDD